MIDEAEPKASNDNVLCSFQDLTKRFYFDNLSVCHVVIGALLGALLSRILGASTDAVLSASAAGGVYGWLIGSTRTGLFVIAGIFIGAIVSLLAGAHGAIAMAVVSNCAIWGWIFSMSVGSDSK
mgnify:CR=1 FL=1